MKIETTLREAAQQALKAYDQHYPLAVVMEDLRAVLAEEALQRLTDVQQEIEAVLEQPETVAWTTMPEAEDWCFVSGSKDPTGKLEGKWSPLYTTPLLRKPLTDADIKLVMNGRGEEGDDDYIKPAFDPYGISEDDLLGFARAIEQAHDIKREA